MKIPRFVPVVIIVSALAAASARATILQGITEDVASASALKPGGGEGEATNSAPTVTDKPVRGGKSAFKHVVNGKSVTSELVTMPTESGGVYWYGWSLQVPENFNLGDKITVMQLAGTPDAAKTGLPCKGEGSFLQIDEKGRLTFHLQHPADDGAVSKCDEFVILDDIAKNKGRWLDLVIHAKWTGDKDGFVECWAKVHDNNFFQRVAYAGRTWWTGSKSGPVFKLGAKREPWGDTERPEVTLYTDEFRLGDAHADFNDVAPAGAEALTAMAGRGRIRYVLYPSALNHAKVPIMVYTPPGYEPDGTQRYPVIYNLHGAGGGSPERQWARMNKTLTQAIDSGEVAPVIYVFVNGLGDTGYLDAFRPDGPKAYSTVVSELIPFIDANYRTIADRRGRAVDGFSMGANGSIMFGTKRPDLFCAFVSYAGTAYRIPPLPAPNPKQIEMRDYLQPYSAWLLVPAQADFIRANLRIRLICGDKDPAYAQNLEFKDFLGTLNIPVSWVSIPDVAHDTKGLFDRVGVESLTFIHAAFAKAGEK